MSDITQSGTGNQAEVNQGNSGFANDESTIAQDGIANRAGVMQTGSPGANGSAIEQVGEGQEAAVTQFASMGFFDGTAIMDSQIHQTVLGIEPMSTRVAKAAIQPFSRMGPIRVPMLFKARSSREQIRS